VDETTSFVAADIPGVIEGAMDGAGLGHYFLRHVERCRLLVHVVDVSGIEGRDPIEDFETINRELAGYSEALSHRPQIVVANKVDIMQDPEPYERFKEYIMDRNYLFFEISAATNQGTRPLVNAVAQELQELPPITIFEADYVPENVEETKMSKEISITNQDGIYVVESPWLAYVMNGINFDDYESRMYFEKVLQNAGVFERLEAMGIQEGDTVSIYECEFDYIK